MLTGAGVFAWQSVQRRRAMQTIQPQHNNRVLVIGGGMGGAIVVERK